MGGYGTEKPTIQNTRSDDPYFDLRQSGRMILLTASPERRSPRPGQAVRVRAGEGTAALRAALERYAFKFEVVDERWSR
jgi:hypothetical protein